MKPNSQLISAGDPLKSIFVAVDGLFKSEVSTRRLIGWTEWTNRTKEWTTDWWFELPNGKENLVLTIDFDSLENLFETDVILEIAHNKHIV